MSKHQTTVTINRSAEEVFDRMTDLSRWSQWHTGHIKAEQTSQGLLSVGATIREVFWLLPPFKGRAIYRITAFEPGKRLEYETLQSPVQAKIWYWLEAVPEGTWVSLGNETQPSVGLRLSERVFPHMGQRMLEGEAQKLKSLLEGS